jgi:hypothetical protein
MAPRFNEGKAIDAVLRRIEARDQAVRQNDGWSPDDSNDPDPLRRVDYVCTVGATLHAFEHTGIEPFAGQIELDIHNQDLFAPIVARFSNRPDREVWEFCYPVDASAGLTGAQVKPVQAALITWIEANAPSLPVTLLYDRYAGHLGQTVPGVPFDVSLHRRSLDSPLFPRESPLQGQFIMRPFAVADIELARTARLQKACQDKFPKLAAWKNDGAKTVLVLEENDLSLTNEQRVADALVRAEAEMPDAADEIFLVSTGIDEKWWVTCLRRAGKTFYDDDERFHEIDPATLTGLTKR